MNKSHVKEFGDEERHHHESYEYSEFLLQVRFKPLSIRSATNGVVANKKSRRCGSFKF
jgi:hypothetical protein